MLAGFEFGWQSVRCFRLGNDISEVILWLSVDGQVKENGLVKRQHVYDADYLLHPRRVGICFWRSAAGLGAIYASPNPDDFEFGFGGDAGGCAASFIAPLHLAG